MRSVAPLSPLSSLWSHVETAYRDVQELCIRARASQLALEMTKGPADVFKRTLVSGGPTGTLIENQPSPELGNEEDPRLARAVDLARDLAFREENAGGPDLVLLRELVRKRLIWLRGKFAEVLSDRDVYYAIFPLVVYFDELVQLGTRGEAGRWEPLQSELYDIDNGGEHFFTILDVALRQQETNPLILEIFYFCLSDGFTGMHQNDGKKLDEYKQRLADRIPVTPVKMVEPAGSRAVELVGFPWQYYVAAAAAVVVTYVLFSWLAASAA